MDDYDQKEALAQALRQAMRIVCAMSIKDIFNMVDAHVESPTMRGWHRGRIVDAIQQVRDSSSQLLNRLDHLNLGETTAELRRRMQW